LRLGGAKALNFLPEGNRLGGRTVVSDKHLQSDLDRLRDILFGERIRALEDRLDEMEQRLQRATLEVNRRLEHEVEGLLSQIGALGKRLDEQILALRAQQMADLKAAGQQWEQQLAAQNQALQELQATLTAELSRLREEVLAWRRHLGTQIIALGEQWVIPADVEPSDSPNES
jgi:chromosome segregation ATPase